MCEINRLLSQLASQVERAVEILKSGGSVAYPIDTAYSWGRDAFNLEDVERCSGGVESTAFDVTSGFPEEGIAKIWSESLKEANRSANCCG